MTDAPSKCSKAEHDAELCKAISMADRVSTNTFNAFQLFDTQNFNKATLYTQADLDAAVMAEREACAKIAAEWGETYDREDRLQCAYAAGLIFRDIRASKTQKTPTS